MGLVQIYFALLYFVHIIIIWFISNNPSTIIFVGFRDNFILLQAALATLVFSMFPFLANLPLWNTRGFIAVVLLHVGVSEPLYYLTHKYFHGNYLLTNYHSLHHSSPVPQPFTGETVIIHVVDLMFGQKYLPFANDFAVFGLFTAGHLTLLEHLVMAVVIGVPILGACLLGSGSTSVIYIYVLMFDLLRCLGHCNIEIVPHQLFESYPFLRYLLYSPT